MTKRPTSTRSKPTWGMVLTLLMFGVSILIWMQQQNKDDFAPVATLTSTADGQRLTATIPSSATSASSATLMPVSTTRPLPTDLPGLEITPISAALYEVTGSVGGLGCPDSRCKEISIYKKGSIIVVTGSVTGTTYKTKKTRLWYQVIFHDGSRIYVHAAYVKPHEVGATN